MSAGARTAPTAGPDGQQGSTPAGQGHLSQGAELARAAAAASRRAESVAARLPPLLVEASRVASTVAAGAHGRRRVGHGDAFWQFRPFMAGDAVSRIDWRQTAKSDRAYIRETEWEAAQTIGLWRDATPSMGWSSSTRHPTKRARADLLLLALAALLLRGGERVTLIGGGAGQGRAALGRLAVELAESEGDNDAPPDVPLPRHARAVLFSDFLAPLPGVQRMVGRIAGRPVTGHMLQILDPAEEALPYQGRVRFEGLERDGAALIGRVEGVRSEYAARLAGQREGLRAIASSAGWTFSTHRTNEPPEAALLGLYLALAPGAGTKARR